MLSTKLVLLLLLLLSIFQYSSAGEAARALLRAGDVPLGRMGKPSVEGATPRAPGWDGVPCAGWRQHGAGGAPSCCRRAAWGSLRWQLQDLGDVVCISLLMEIV